MQSGRTGRTLHRIDGKPGDQAGFAVTDAGDLDRDGRHEFLSGAPRQAADTEGHAYLYSGRTGSCCTRSRARSAATPSAPR